MSLQADMVHAVFRLTGDYHPGTGFSERGVIGTGFIMTVNSETKPDVKHGYVVTAAHVVKDQSRVDIQTVDSQTGHLHEPREITGWVEPLPGMDIAVAPIHEPPPDQPVTALALERYLIPNKRIVGLTLGAKVYYIGILTPLDRVMVRAGTIGALDQHGLPEYEGYTQPAHIIDCRSYGGFSGSPCWVEIPVPVLKEYSFPVPEGDPQPVAPQGQMGYYVYLAGMFTAHLDETHPHGGPVSLYGVGIMLRGQEIREALMTTVMVDDRKRRDVQYG
jgi:hypothetical protein